jgi:hypothetical protein
LLQNVSLSAFHVYERENILQAKVELADVVVAKSRSDSGHVLRLFFPFSNPYPLTEFASYLIYRGIRVEGEGAVASSKVSSTAVIISPAIGKDGLCVDYRGFVCHADSSPDSGDLVIELPDDIESTAQIKPYRMGGEQLIAYNPRPDIPQWMDPMLSYLRIVSYRWRFTNVSDRWLHASITEWR